ncbi:efflux transporter outer membrane subunit [Achromobacter xylosoxidans]
MIHSTRYRPDARPARRMRLRHAPLAAALAALVAVAGCASHDGLRPAGKPLDLAALDAGQDIAAAVRDTADDAAPWWRAWGDDQLDRLMADALRQAPGVRAAQARLGQAEAVFGSVDANRQPTLDGSATITADRYPGHYTYGAPYADNTGGSGSLLASLRLRLDIWGKWRALADAARLDAEGAALAHADAQLALQQGIAAAYLRLDAAFRLHELARQQRERQRQALELHQTRRQAGLGSDAPVADARGRLARMDAEVERLDREIARQRHALAALAGQAPGYGDALRRPGRRCAPTPPCPRPCPPACWACGPTCWRNASASTRRTGASRPPRAEFYPDIDLKAFAGLQSLGLSHLLQGNSLAAGIGPALTLPIFDGGRLRAGLRDRIAGYDLAVADYDATVVRALQEVADGLAGMAQARARRDAARVSLREAGTLARLQAVRASRGLSARQDEIDTDLERLRADSELAAADLDLGLARTALAGALGGRWSPSQSSDNEALK